MGWGSTANEIQNSTVTVPKAVVAIFLVRVSPPPLILASFSTLIAVPHPSSTVSRELTLRTV